MTQTELINRTIHRLGELTQPVVTRYQLGCATFRSAHELQITDLDSQGFAACELPLLQLGIIRPIPGLRSNKAYTLLGTVLTDPRILACGLDPFCYVSHLSAMEFHGLTDRMPEILYVSTPAAKEWKAFAHERMAQDLGDEIQLYLSSGLPEIQNLSFTKALGKTVHRTASIHLGAYRVYPEQHLRIATLGRTFLDMLKSPDLCGGITHVIDCFRTHAKSYLRLIEDEIDQHGTAIDKVRAGYILETLCHISDARIEHWKTFARRGGSRKLDSSVGYSEQFSEAWCLSINVPIPTE